MPTPIGDGPNGGVLMQDDDGSHYEVKGNSVTPVAKPSPSLGQAAADAVGAGAALVSQGIPGLVGSWALKQGQQLATGEGAGDGSLLKQAGGGLAKVGAKAFDALGANTAAEYLQRKGDDWSGPAKAPAPVTGPEAPIVSVKPLAQPAAAPAPVKPLGGGAAAAPAPQVDTKDFDKATQQGQDALKRQGEAKAKAALAEGNEWTRAADESTAALAKFQENAKAAQGEGERRIQEENNEIAKLGSGGKVDPDHFWKSTSTGGKVLGSISLMLGGLAHGMGAENVGAKMLAEDIERDVAAQKFNIEQTNDAQKARVAAKATAFGHFLAVTGNAQTAELAAKAWGLDAAKTKVEGMKASLSAPAEIAAADRLIAELGQKAAENKNQAIQLNSQLKGQALAQQGQSLANEHTRLQIQQQRAMMAAASGGRVLDKAAVPPALRDRAVYVGGKAYIDDNDKRAGEKREQVDATKRAVAGIDGLVKYLEENPYATRMPGLEPNKIAKAKAIQIATDFQQASGIKNAVPAELMADMVHVLEAGPTAGAGAIKGAAEGTRARFLGALKASFETGGLPDPTADLFGAQPTEAQAEALKKAGR